MQWKKKAEEVARGSLEEMGLELEKAGFRVKRIIKTGFPRREILEKEEQEKPSLIVIGALTSATCSLDRCPTG